MAIQALWFKITMGRVVHTIADRRHVVIVTRLVIIFDDAQPCKSCKKDGHTYVSCKGKDVANSDSN